MPDNIDDIIKLDQRTRANKFGKVVITPDVIPPGAHGVLTLQPKIAEQRTNIQVLLAYLVEQFSFNYRRDSLELNYENGLISLARLTFYP